VLNHVIVELKTNASDISSSSIIRIDVVMTPMMETEEISETLLFISTLTWLEDLSTSVLCCGNEGVSVISKWLLHHHYKVSVFNILWYSCINVKFKHTYRGLFLCKVAYSRYDVHWFIE
jgi:hypothetical protein